MAALPPDDPAEEIEDDVKAAIDRVSSAAVAALEAAKACQLPKTAANAAEVAEEAKHDSPSMEDLRQLEENLQNQFLTNKCENDENH